MSTVETQSSIMSGMCWTCSGGSCRHHQRTHQRTEEVSNAPKGEVCQGEDSMQAEHDRQMAAMGPEMDAIFAASKGQKRPLIPIEVEPEAGGGRRMGQGRKY